MTEQKNEKEIQHLASRGDEEEASVLIQRLSYPAETVLSNKMSKNGIVLSFKDSPRIPLRRRPEEEGRKEEDRTVIADHATARTDSQNAKIIMSLKAYPKQGFNNVQVSSPIDISITGWSN